MVQSRAAQSKRMTPHLSVVKVPLLLGFCSKGQSKSTSFLHHPHPLSLHGLAMDTTQLCHNRTAFCSHGHYKVSSPWDSSASSRGRKVNFAFRIPICKTKPTQRKKKYPKRDIGLKITNIYPVLLPFLPEKEKNQNWFLSRPCG